MFFQPYLLPKNRGPATPEVKGTRPPPPIFALPLVEPPIAELPPVFALPLVEPPIAEPPRVPKLD